ncbi:MAG: PAS domain S-box protein [Piscinibacter sp.]|nr:PAS domain S-box protein [Piscinibacter sp.]
MSPLENPARAAADASLLPSRLAALRRIALAVAQPGGPEPFAMLVAELAESLQVSTAFVAVFADPQRCTLRTLAAWMDGRALASFDYAVEGSPCAQVVGRDYRYVAAGVAAEFRPGTIFRAKGMDSYAAYPLHDGHGEPLGLLVAMDRTPIADGDAEHAEAMLKIVAVRAAAEIERRAAGAALRRSEASYRAIFDAAEDAVLIHDWDTGAILDVNPKACETYGWPRDEWPRLTVADISAGEPPYTAEHAAQWMARARAGDCPPFEWRRRNKDGSLHWDEVRLKPAVIDGRPHLLAFTRDITERKAAIEALQMREEQYRAIFEAASDGFVLWDSNLRVVDANPAMLRMYGYSRDEVIGRDYSPELPADYVRERLSFVRRALAGETVQVETTALRADARHSSFDIDLRVMPFRHRGQPHALAIARDISERRERERALQRSEARLRATVEAAFDAVIGMDGEGRIVEFNAAAERIFGHRRADALGRLLAELILPERHREAHTRGLKHFRASGRGPMLGRLVETTALTADGREIPVELAISVAAVPEGSIFVGHLRDISARRAAELERGRLEAQLRQAQKMEAIGQLTGGIAHDFNNILTSVIGYLVMGQERAETLGDATLVRQLGQAHLAAQRARELIAQMLAFARRRPVARRTLAPAPLARQAVQLLRATLPSSILLDTQGLQDDAALPPVEADAVQLEQVLFNLCINARDALPGAGRLRVGLQCARGGWQCRSCGERVDAGTWVELRVADDGSGIAPDVMQRMFDPFYTTKEVGHGSGMGLAMVHGIVHDHGGHVVVDSAPGQGATFRVMLPAAPAPLDTAELAAPPAAPAGTLAGRVLLVEDEPMVGNYLAELLGSWGLQVTLLRDPRAALDRLADGAQAVDLLLTDHTMPQLTGLQLAHEARRLRPGLPVLLVSGNADGFDEQALAASGVQAALAKPIDPERLRTLLRELLAGRG